MLFGEAPSRGASDLNGLETFAVDLSLLVGDSTPDMVNDLPQ